MERSTAKYISLTIDWENVVYFVRVWLLLIYYWYYWHMLCLTWRWTELSPALLHSRRRHAVTTTAFVRLWSAARTDHPSIYSRQSHIHSFWRCGMERPAGSYHSCAITRGLQTAPQDISVFTIIASHCHLTHKLLLYLCGPSNNFII